jgi:hypothetical protein
MSRHRRKREYRIRKNGTPKPKKYEYVAEWGGPPPKLRQVVVIRTAAKYRKMKEVAQ